MRPPARAVVLVLAGLAWAARDPAGAGERRAPLAAPVFPSAGPLIAGESAPDTGLSRFLGGLSDSTDRIFGIAAAAPDTTGQDSALAFGLAHPRRFDRRRALRIGRRPDFAFNRADGPVWGGEMWIGEPRLWGRLGGEVGYAAGPNRWLGKGYYRYAMRRHDVWWSLSLEGGRASAAMNRDHPDVRLATLRALYNGNDRKQYFRRDGARARLIREAVTWRAVLGYRDMLESPLVTTTTWNLRGQVPAVTVNLPAALGRVRELELDAAWRMPRVPLTGEVEHQTSGSGIGSDFEYRRYRLALSGDFGLGRMASFVPQLTYGRLTGRATPQESFYLGGSSTLRSLPGDSRGGSGIALARLDVIGTADLLRLAHVPHPDAFPLQAGLFAGIGAVWGVDPYGGPPRAGVDWPNGGDWASEAGASLLYQPGIPDPTGFIRLNFAFPLGPDRENSRFTLSYSRALDLVKAF